MKIYSICVLTVLCLLNVSKVSSHDSQHSCSYFGVTPKHPFNQKKYLGPWYIHQMSDWEGEHSIKHYNCYVQIQSETDAADQHKFEEIIVEDGHPPIYYEGILTFHDSGAGNYIYSSDDSAYTFELDVIATDYSTYSIEWSCTDTPDGGSTSFIFVMSRSPVVRRALQKRINQHLDEANIDRNHLRTLGQSCPKELVKEMKRVRGGGGLVGLVGGVLSLVIGLVSSLLSSLLG